MQQASGTVAEPVTVQDAVATDAGTPDPTPVVDGPRPITYEPGLDGLRAVALLSIFVVHADIGLAPGGFLAVSTFFTLSGFLITALLATEHRRNGRIDLKAFWLRRARRLLPASLMAIALIVVASVVLGGPAQNDHLGGDVVGSLAYVANWRFLRAGTSYGATYADQSPLLHFWSLAIEEQFYLVFPLVAVGAFALARRWRRAAYAVLGTGVALSLVAGIVGVSSDSAPDHLYFRTDIRAGELLMGALFGLWWVDGGRRLPAGVHRAIQGAGGVLLVLMVTLIATSDYHDDFWYQGGLLAYTLVTVGVVLAAVEPAGLVRRLLSCRPLVAAGVVSYAAYLVHWPLFLWLRTETTVPGWVRLVGGTALALAVAALSHRLVEQPIRQRRLFPAPLLVGTGVLLVVAAVAMSAKAPALARRLDRDAPEVSLDRAEGAVEDHIATTAAAKGQAPTVGLFGDSTSLITSLGLATFDDTDPTIRLGAGYAGLGCTINAPATFKVFGEDTGSNAECTGWLENWKLASRTGDLDLAFVQFGPWEVKEVKVEGSDEFRTIGDPVLDARDEQLLTDAIAALLEHTPVVVIATSPYIEPGRVNGKPPTEQEPDADPARMDRLNEIIESVAARFPQVAVLDLAGWLERSGEDDRLRPDGIHFTDKTALELAPRFASTLASIEAVAAGADEPAADDPDLFPVQKYATAD